MSHEIWKFPLKHGTNALHMPKGSRLLSVHEQGRDAMLWALCPLDAPEEIVMVQSVMTGERIGGDALGECIGTTLQGNGSFVLHHFAERGVVTNG